jgi:acetylornithine deacetylase
MPTYGENVSALSDISTWLDQNKGRILELARELVRTPSENLFPHGDHGNEAACQRIIEQRLVDLEFSVDSFVCSEVEGFDNHPLRIPGVNYRERPNLVAHYPGTGGGRSLIINGHVDTVRGANGAVGGPFSAEVRNGYLFGRGSLDTKGSLAAALVAIQCLRELDLRLDGDLILQSVVDEEYGAGGTLACCLRGYRADGAIVLEPTQLTICPRNVGGKQWCLSFSGPGAIDAPRGSNPLYRLAAVLDALRLLEKKTDIIKGITTFHLQTDQQEDHSCIVDPDSWKFLIWIECAATASENDVDTLLHGALQECYRSSDLFRDQTPSLEVTFRFCPGHVLADDHPLVRSVADSYEAALKRPAEVAEFPFYTDAFLLQTVGKTPSVIFGPGGGGMHAPDEFVKVEDLLSVAKTLCTSIVHWCGVTNG